MKESKLNPVDGPAMSDKVYALALARIEAVMGCTEDSPKEAELVLWAEIADAHERTSGTVTVDTAGLGIPPRVTVQGRWYDSWQGMSQAVLLEGPGHALAKANTRPKPRTRELKL